MLFKYYEIICEDAQCLNQVEDTLGIRSWPQLLIYPFGPKTERKLIQVDSDEDLHSLARDLLEFVEIREKLIDDKNIMHYGHEALMDKKYLVVWFYHTEDQFSKLMIHTFSNIAKFQKHLTFGRYPDPDQNSQRYWQFSRVPHAITIEHPSTSIMFLAATARSLKPGTVRRRVVNCVPYPGHSDSSSRASPPMS